MIYLILSSLVIIVIMLYKRYFPVLGVNCRQLKELDLSTMVILDLRDYNESYKSPIEGAINIPLAYLKRNFHEIPNINLHLVVTSLLEKNIGIRDLKGKGYRVVSYSLISNKFKKTQLKIEVNC
jgi:hypothetical protein